MSQGWATRLNELAVFRPTTEWADVWALMVRGQRVRSLQWIEEQLWQWKFAAWVLLLDADPTTCRSCGGRIDKAHALSRYCQTACRKVAFRRRKAGDFTPFESLVAEARQSLKQVRHEIQLAHRGLRRLGKGAFTFPPDLTRLDHLPKIPPRCGAGCERGSECTHTQKGVCLFAATGEIDPHDE